MDEVGQLYRAQNKPYSALIELTYKCNLKCFHCFNHHQKKQELSTAQIINAMQQLANLGVLHLTLTGGEVYSHPDFELILEKAKNLGFALNVFTNGTMLTTERAQFLKKMGVLEVSLTLFSIHPEVHDEIAKQKGSHTATLKALALLHDAQLHTRVKCLIMKRNFKDYEKVKSLVEGYGAVCHYDTTIMPANGNDTSVLNEKLSREQLKQVYSNPDVYHISENPLNDLDAQNKLVRENFCDYQLQCNAGILFLTINPYGEVYSCIQQKHSAGNLLENSLKNIWESSPEFLKARAVSLDSLSECSSCGHQSYCGRCPALAEKVDGDFYGASSEACERSEIQHEVFEELKKYSA